MSSTSSMSADRTHTTLWYVLIHYIYCRPVLRDHLTISSLLFHRFQIAVVLLRVGLNSDLITFHFKLMTFDSCLTAAAGSLQSL